MVENNMTPAAAMGILDQRVKRLGDGNFQASLTRVDLHGLYHVDTALGTDIPSALAAIKDLRINAATARFLELRERYRENGATRTDGNGYGHNFGPGERLKQYLVEHRQKAAALYDQTKNTYVPREEL